jgi:hypothetical protein
MAEIVNLRRARKSRARVEKDAQAAENRTQFGRTKAEKRATETERAQTEADLDGKKMRDDQEP